MVQNTSQHFEASGQNLLNKGDLLTILTTKHHESFEDKESIVNGHSIVNQDEQKENDTEKAVHEKKQDGLITDKFKTETESFEDSKSNVQKEQILETIGEEYYLYDDH